MQRLLTATIFFLCSNVIFAVEMDVYHSEPVVIDFTRHTFRGPSKITPSPVPVISNLNIQNPVLSYGMNATTLGLQITQQFAEKAYNQGARLALKTIHTDPSLAGHWSLIRPDLSSERTFATAVRLQQGLSSLMQRTITLIGCPTEEGDFVDPIATTAKKQKRCISPALLEQQRKFKAAEITPYTISLTNQLIQLLGGIPALNTKNFDTMFPHIKLLCSLIEFNSDFDDAPLQHILKNKKITSEKINREAVILALNILGYGLLLENTGILRDASALAKLQFIQSLQSGAQEIVVTHDDQISGLLQSLGFLSSHSPPNDLAIYPLETVTIALNTKYVALVRTRINMNKNGSMTGQAGFTSWVVWTGTRAEWDAHVAAIRARVYHDVVIRNCIQKIAICHPVSLRLRIEPSQKR